MSTIGLYDIDLNHSNNFSLSLPLMKAYTKFYKEGHQIIMMSPYEKTGRYNKVFYFKDNPKLIVPKNIVFNEKSSLHGYGFYKNSTLSKEVAALPPSFEPYEFSSRIKNKKLLKSIKNNNFIDWREKDFTYMSSGKTYTYINDRDFMEEYDWKDLFKNFDNNIEFIHPLYPINNNQAKELLLTYFGTKTVVIKPSFNEDDIKFFSQHINAYYDVSNENEMLLLIFAGKILTENAIRIPLIKCDSPYKKRLAEWGKKGQISFKEFLGKDFDDKDYLKTKNRLLLKQNPKKITFKEFKSEYLTF